MSSWSCLRLVRSRDAAGGLVVRFGVVLLDAYLEFLAVRSRPNTVVAVAYDLKVFFAVVGKAPGRVVAGDVLAFVTAQYAGGPARRLQVAGEAGGVSARTVRRRLSSVSGLFAFLQARGDVEANPVPRGLPTRRERQRPRQGVPLVRTPRTLPRILQPVQVDALLAALQRRDGVRLVRLGVEAPLCGSKTGMARFRRSSRFSNAILIYPKRVMPAALAKLPDLRARGGFRHRLTVVVTAAMCAVVAGYARMPRSSNGSPTLQRRPSSPWASPRTGGHPKR